MKKKLTMISSFFFIQTAKYGKLFDTCFDVKNYYTFKLICLPFLHQAKLEMKNAIIYYSKHKTNALIKILFMLFLVKVACRSMTLKCCCSADFIS